MSKVFFLDFDGVIVDSLGYYLKSANHALEQLGYRPELGPEHIEPLERVDLALLAEQMGVAKEIREHYIAEVVEHMQNHHEPLPLFAEMDRVIEQLAQQGEVVIVSLSVPSLIERACSPHGLMAHIHRIYSRLDPGAKHEQMHHWLSERGHEAEGAVLVGDSVSDVRAAQRAGIRSVGVTWGWQPNRIRDCGADWVVETPMALQKQLIEGFHV